MNKVIVSGANGFIGSNLINYLIDQNIQVYAIDKFWEKDSFANDNRIVKVTCTLDDINNLPTIINDRGFDAFYHLAWAGSTGMGRSNYRLQSANANAVCDAAIASKDLECRKFITPGTITEFVAEDILKKHYTSESLIYARAKIYAHNMLDVIANKYGINYVWTRFTNIFGGNNKSGNLISYTLSEFENNRVPIFGPCTQPYNFTYIKDVVKALYIIGNENANSTEYFISNGECRILHDYLETLSSICGKRIDIGGRNDDGITYQKEWFSNEQLVKDYQYQPDYSFEDGVKELLGL